MHFHIMSLLVILPLFHSATRGMAVNVILMAAFAVITAVINYKMDYPPTMLYTQPEIEYGLPLRPVVIDKMTSLPDSSAENVGTTFWTSISSRIHTWAPIVSVSRSVISLIT